MSTEEIIFSCLIGILLIIICFMANALINEQIKSTKYLANFIELFNENYEKETEKIKNDALRRDEIQ